MVCINLVNRAARSSTSGLLARPWLTWGTGWERTGDEMGVVSCCVGVAAERTEAPGRVPEGVKPRCCGQMDAKGNKVIKEEEAERRVKAIEAEGSKSGRWVGRIKLVLENSARRAGHVDCVFYFFDFDSRVMFIYFFFFGLRSKLFSIADVL